MEKPFGVIYLIRNTVNGKKYIGQAIDFERRMRDHKYESKKDLPTCIIDRAIAKHGWESFQYMIIYDAVDREDLNFKEEYYIALYNSRNKAIGYNILPGGSGASGKDHPMYGKIGKDNPCYGENSPNAKLTWAEVNEIRLNLDNLTINKLVEKYKISQATISDILNNKTWIIEDTSKINKVKDIVDHSGENNSQAKLTWDQVILIRLNPDNLSQTELAEKYKIIKQQINDIINNKIWIIKDPSKINKVIKRADNSGEKCPTAKLTWEQIDLIRLNPDNLSQTELAERYKVNRQHINSIVNNKRWKIENRPTDK